MEDKIKLQPQEQEELKEICLNWVCNAKCAPPPPHFIKLATLLRHSLKDSTWIETGTYLGETAIFLAKFSCHVHTIEPSEECIKIASPKLAKFKNITIHKGSSEQCLDKVLSSVKGKVCFWLDGHYSLGITYKGKNETPIKYELSIIEKYINKIDEFIVLVDDIRMSNEDSKNYPPIEYYIDWSKKNDLNWTIENDIFIAKSKE